MQHTQIFFGAIDGLAGTVPAGRRDAGAPLKAVGFLLLERLSVRHQESGNDKTFLDSILLQ